MSRRFISVLALGALLLRGGLTVRVATEPVQDVRFRLGTWNIGGVR